MTLSTQRFDQLAAGVRGLDGVDAGSLAGVGLFGAHLAIAETIAELKRVYAPLAARIADLSVPGTAGFARAHGYAAPEKLIAAGLGGTLAEARMLIEAGRALGDPGDGGDGSEDEDDEDDEERQDDHGGPGPGPGPDEGEGAAAERERRRREWEQEQLARERERARRAGLTPTARALEDGHITADAAAVIRATLRALDADTPELSARLREVEAQLVGKAARVSLTDLRTACERAAAAFDASRAEARARRLFEARGIYFSKQADGSIRVSGQLDPETASGLMALADAYTTQAFRAARDHDVPESRTPAQMRADALAVLADHLLGCTAGTTGMRATVMVQVDLKDLTERSGVALNHTTGTAMFAGDLRRWCAETGIIPVVMGSGSQPLDVGRTERLCTAAQKKALIVRDHGCVWCGAPAAWTDAHHIRHWADGGTTDLDNMVLLCRSCHTRVHSTAWAVTRHRGRTWIIPPPDIDPKQTPRPSARDRTSPAAGTTRAPETLASESQASETRASEHANVL